MLQFSIRVGCYLTINPFIFGRFNYQGEEDDLSEVATEDVPEQVRHWLTSTFSRQSTRSRLGDEKPKFRSIVQALRTGLFIDRYNQDKENILVNCRGNYQKW